MAEVNPKRSGAVSSSLTVFLQSLLKSVSTAWSYCLCVANTWIFHKKLNTIFPTSSWLQRVIKFSVLIPCDISLLVIRVAETLWLPLLFPSWTLSCFLLNHPKTVWNCPIIIFMCLPSLNFSSTVFLSFGAIFCFVFCQLWFCLANDLGTIAVLQGFSRERGPLQMACGQAAVARGISSTCVPKTSTQTEGLVRQTQVFLVKWGMLCVTAHVQGWFYIQVFCEQWNFPIVSPVSWLKPFQQRNSSLRFVFYHRAIKYCALYFEFCLALNYLVLIFLCEALSHAIRRHLHL